MALGWMLSILQRGRAAMQRLNELLRGRAGDREPAGRRAPSSRSAARSRSAASPSAIPARPDAPRRARRRRPDRPGRAHGGDRRADGRGEDARSSSSCRGSSTSSAGSVLLDGRDVRTLPLGWLRRHVGLVPQDPFLFSRTIRENVAFALDGDGDGRRRRGRSRMAGLERDLADMPRGLDTIVGERGITLSGGQKQRVDAGARARRGAARARPRRRALERRRGDGAGDPRPPARLLPRADDHPGRAPDHAP